MTLPRLPAKVFGVEVPEAVNLPIVLAQKYLVDPIKHYQHRTIIPLEGGHGSTLGGTIATMASATAACLFLSATPDLLALARNGADKSAAEAIAWTLGTALGPSPLPPLRSFPFVAFETCQNASAHGPRSEPSSCGTWLELGLGLGLG